MCNLSIGIAKENAYKGYNKGYNVGEKHGEQIGLVRGEQIGLVRGEQIGEKRGIDGERKRMTIGLLKKQVAIPIIISVSGLEEDDVRRIAEEEHLPC